MTIKTDRIDVIHEYTHRGSKFTVKKVITEDKALELQEKAGYHPAGYGFHSFVVSDEGTTWECFSSCD